MASKLDTVLVGNEPLQLSIEETADLLSLRGISMDPAELHAATAGHPLLTRATMTVYGQAGTGSICASVNTAVEDFLQMSLAQSTLGHAVKDFMIRTSIPESFTLELAAQMSGANNVTAILDDLEDKGLGMWFDIAGHRRFEYTTVVRTLLLRSVKSIDPRVTDRLTRIVIEHDLAVGNTINALRQAVTLGDLNLASQIACDHHITLLVSQTQAVRIILETLPISRLRKYPVLVMALALGHSALPSGRVKSLEYFGLAIVFAGMYRSSMDPGQRIWMLTLESTAMRFIGKLDGALKFANRAVQSFEESPWDLQERLAALEPTLYDQAAIAHIHAHQFERAEELLLKALDASRRAGSGPSALLTRGLLAFTLGLAGKSIEARVHLKVLESTRWPPGMLDGYWATTFRLAQVREALDRQSFEEASAYLDLINDEMQVSEFWPSIVTFRSMLDLHLKGQVLGPATLEAKIRQANRWPLNPAGQIDLDCLRANSYLAAGQSLKAAAALTKHSRNEPRVQLTRARIALYSDDPTRTLLLTGKMDGVGPRVEVHRLLLRAAAMERLNDPAGARDNAQAAASFMKEYGLTMTAALLPGNDIAVVAGHVHTTEPGILAPVSLIPARAQTASLSPRELVVLNSFATHGAANDVAVALNVSVNTVKSQRRSILKKLGAHSLEEALAVARRQRILED
ncbi:LuxR C-terminal-related transcriptional regulator [Arthrobacter sp. UYCo732]|uniref:helix-turn-helix transcriptional regulator n=1 Tax=Arthrobacter sp. UYCo732 TaxID=3156336 RepID=UPI00339719CB